MRVIARPTLRTFWNKHQDSEQSLKAWLKEAEKSSWVSPKDLKAFYATVSILEDNRAVFNIKGNKYRLVVKIHYSQGIVYIRFIGTHAQYDAIDAATI